MRLRPGTSEQDVSTGLFENSVLIYRNRRRWFQITDASGRLLAESEPLQGGSGPNRFTMMPPQFYETSPFSIRVHDTDGRTVCYIERPEGESITFVTDDDRLAIGRMERTPVKPIIGQKAKLRDHFLDMRENLVGIVAWEDYSGKQETPERKHRGEFMSPDGQRVGRFERDILRLDYRFSRPLHTLLVVSPILFHLQAGR